MNWIVLKFGGTSVSSVARWHTVATIVRARVRQGYRPLVVCSALSGVSDALEEAVTLACAGDHADKMDFIRRRHLELGAELGVDAGSLLQPYFEDLREVTNAVSQSRTAAPSLQARVLAAGELMSTTLGAAFLDAQGVKVLWCDARDMLVSRPAPGQVSESRRFLSAVCDSEPDSALKERLSGLDADVFLTQGFIARDADGNTVVLGRGGSDTSAAYLGSKLQAERVEIWTDVPGMFTADPTVIPSARLLTSLDYGEAQELATTGARVLHPACIEPLKNHHIPLHIKSTALPDLPGTVISNEAADQGARVKALSVKRNVTLISMETLGMWHQSGFLANVFAVFSKFGLSVDLVATSESNVTVSLDPLAVALEPDAVAAIMRDLEAYCTPAMISPCATISVVGRQIRSILDQLAPAFEVFADHLIYLVSQAASDLNFSFVVDQEQAPRLVRKLHAQLIDKKEAGAGLGPTWQTLSDPHVGNSESEPWWVNRRDDLIRLGAARTPRYVYDVNTIVARAAGLRDTDMADEIYYAIKANPNRDVLRILYKQGIGFECVSPGEVRRVREAVPDIAPRRILFTPNFAPREEYVYGFEEAVWVTLDNIYPLEAWPEVFEGRSILVRIDPGRGDGHHRHVRTAGKQSKFGIALDEWPRLLALCRRLDVRVEGLHAHVGSGISDPQSWADVARLLGELAADHPSVRVVNIGGGFSVPDRRKGSRLDMGAIGDGLRAFRSAHPQLALWMEPGRYLVAEAGVLLTSVAQGKQKGSRHFVGVDAGMHTLLRPSLYGAYHEIVNLTRFHEPPTVEVDVVGPICETGDVLGHGRRLPPSKPGDVILIATAGAYGYIMGSGYNLRTPADEVLLQPAKA